MDLHEFESHQFESLLLKFVDDVSDHVPVDAVGFDHDKAAFLVRIPLGLLLDSFGIGILAQEDLAQGQDGADHHGRDQEADHGAGEPILKKKPVLRAFYKRGDTKDAQHGFFSTMKYQD